MTTRLISSKGSTKLSLTTPWDHLNLPWGDSKKLEMHQAWGRVGWLRRCVSIRAGAVATMPWAIYKEGQEDAVWTHEDAKPPDDLAFLGDLATHLFLIEAALALEGRAGFVKEMENGRLILLFWVNPTRWVPKHRDGGWGMDRRLSNGMLEKYGPDEALIILEPDVYRDHNHAPRTSDGGSVRVNADVLDSLATFLDKHLDSGLIKATLTSVPSGTPEPERNRLKAFLGNLFGSRNAGQHEVLSSEVNVQTIGEGLKELSDANLTREQREAIATGLGIPHGLIMSNETGAKATADADQVNFYLGTAIPQARLIQRAINAGLFAEMKYRLQFEPHKLEIMQRHELEKAQVIQALSPGVPVLTQDELREMLGYEPLPSGEEPEVRFTGKAAEKALIKARRDELTALRRALDNKGLDYDFSPDYLTRAEVEVVRERRRAGEPWEYAADLDLVHP